ncbi:MLO-like protein 12 [Citrus sinensis]|uniref:MLO-like protein 12 n=1 Tax=Citrus sinensis TaxID=2711 RepID=A0ACB8NGY1_CITSI|nr:MLO-like protein 12 [Citrus sinensis]
MAGETTVEERSIEVTPTWAVATVCLMLISVSVLIEHLLHLLAKYFNKKKKSSLIQTLHKIKSDLMMLGFMSLILTVSEKRISNICIPKSMAETFLPCGTMDSDDYSEEELKCVEQGKVSLLSRKGVNQLQYLIFVLAFFHSLSCVLTFSLGMAKMRSWESWEAETRTLEYQFTNDPRRFRFTHQTSFGKRHLRFWSEHSRLLRWPACFLRQFYASVSRTDYLTLRRGFITAHFAKESHFNFQRYINRALEKDFGMVAGMSWWIWIISVLFIFFNAQGFYNYLWLPFIPLVMLLVVGTKLEGIITQMCLDSHGKSQVVIGPLLVRPSDHYFWFNWPKLLLHVIHLVLLQNSFQLAFFAWTWYKFGLRSCFHEKTEDIIIKIVLGVVVHMLCGYVTLPLYALVTQMGSSMKNAVFPESVAHGLKRWRGRARKNLRTNDYYSARPSSVDDASVSLDASLSLDASPSFSLHPSYSVDREGDPPSDLKDTKFVAVEIDDGQVGKQHQKI